MGFAKGSKGKVIEINSVSGKNLATGNAAIEVEP
jgi:hypothetical protein